MEIRYPKYFWVKCYNGNSMRLQIISICVKEYQHRTGGQHHHCLAPIAEHSHHTRDGPHEGPHILVSGSHPHHVLTLEVANEYIASIR